MAAKRPPHRIAACARGEIQLTEKVERLRPAWGRISVGAPAAALGLTVLLLILLSAVSALFVWQSYRDLVHATEARAESAAQIVGAHVRWVVESSYQALRRIDETLGARPDIFLATTVGDLDAAVASLPGGVTTWVVDQDGDTVLTSASDSTPQQIGDVSYFDALRRGDEWHISPLTEAADGQKVFVIGRRIERDGRFLGAALVAVPAGLLLEFWVTLNLGPQSSVGLFREDGWLVSRFPVPDAAIDLSGYVLFTTLLPQSPSGVYPAESPADGTSRIVGYYSVPGMPLVTVAGISTHTVAADFWARVARVATVALPIAIALLIVSLWVARLLKKDERQRVELVRALEQNRMLFREIHHRVKNNLQTVTALIQMQALPPETKQELAGRIGAMTAIHEHIYSSDQFGALDLGAYVRRLVQNLKESNAGDVEVHCELAQIEVEAERALPLGMIISEVVTNAFKHAFPDGRRGRIDILLKAAGPSSALLEIRDDGIGASSETGSGMGSRLIQGLARQIGAQYEYRRDGGTVFIMRFPLLPAS